jgi:hypothetical protein
LVSKHDNIKLHIIVTITYIKSHRSECDTHVPLNSTENVYTGLTFHQSQSRYSPETRPCLLCKLVFLTTVTYVRQKKVQFLLHAHIWACNFHMTLRGRPFNFGGGGGGIYCWQGIFFLGSLCARFFFLSPHHVRFFFATLSFAAFFSVA